GDAVSHGREQRADVQPGDARVDERRCEPPPGTGARLERAVRPATAGGEWSVDVQRRALPQLHVSPRRWRLTRGAERNARVQHVEVRRRGGSGLRAETLALARARRRELDRAVLAVRRAGRGAAGLRDRERGTVVAVDP